MARSGIQEADTAISAPSERIIYATPILRYHGKTHSMHHNNIYIVLYQGRE